MQKEQISSPPGSGNTSRKIIFDRVEALPYGVALTSSSGLILYGNPTAFRLLNATAAPVADLHAFNFTPAWAAIRNALPGLKMVRDNHLTICYMDRLRNFSELTVCLAGLDAGTDRHLLLLSRREADAHASSAHTHRQLLECFSASCRGVSTVGNASNQATELRKQLANEQSA